MLFDKLTVGTICLKAARRGTEIGHDFTISAFPKTIIGVINRPDSSGLNQLVFSLRERDFKLIPMMSGSRPSGRVRQYKLKSLILAQNERWRHG